MLKQSKAVICHGLCLLASIARPANMENNAIIIVPNMLQHLTIFGTFLETIILCNLLTKDFI